MSAAPLFELRRYVAVEGRAAAVADRFRTRTLPLFAAHGFVVESFWEDVDDPGVLVYVMRWDDRAAMDAAWEAFIADPEWKRIVAETEVDGPIVASIERTCLRTFG